MSKFSELCQQVANRRHSRNYTYNWGDNYIGITFNTYEEMFEFKKTDLYQALKPYKQLTRFTKYLYFEDYDTNDEAI